MLMIRSEVRAPGGNRGTVTKYYARAKNGQDYAEVVLDSGRVTVYPVGELQALGRQEAA